MNMRIVKCFQLCFWSILALAAIGCGQHRTQLDAAPQVKNRSLKSAPTKATLQTVSSLPPNDPLRSSLRKSGLCVYALETESGNIVRASLDGSKVTVLMETQIRNQTTRTEVVGSDVESRSGQTGYISVRGLTSDNTKTAFLDSCIVDPKDPLWTNNLSLEGMCKSKASPDRTDSVHLDDLSTKQAAGWVLVASYSTGELEPGHWHEYVKSANLFDGKTSLALDQRWRFLGLAGPSAALFFDGNDLVAWDLKKDKKYSILKARSLTLWRRDAYQNKFPPVVMRASIFDGNSRRPCLWKMKDPKDIVAKPEYLADSSQLEPYSDLQRRGLPTTGRSRH